MSEFVFLLEEPSARAMLEGLLPKVLSPSIPCRFIVFDGKQNLEKQSWTSHPTPPPAAIAAA